MKGRWLPLLLLCLILAGCGTVDAGDRLISAAEGAEAYSGTLVPFLPGYSLQTAEDTLYAEVSRGSAVACFDVQAIPALERGIGRYWYPHVTATVILAVDRSRHRLEQPSGESGPRGHQQQFRDPQYAGSGRPVLRSGPGGALQA